MSIDRCGASPSPVFDQDEKGATSSRRCRMGSHQDTDDRIDPNLAALAAALGELYARPIIRGDSPEAKRLIRSFILANRELVTLAIDTVLGMNADERARLFRDHEGVLHPPGGGVSRVRLQCRSLGRGRAWRDPARLRRRPGERPVARRPICAVRRRCERPPTAHPDLYRPMTGVAKNARDQSADGPVSSSNASAKSSDGPE